jgi:hypothetical protein
MPEEICKDHREQLQRVVSRMSAIADENEFLGWLSGMNVVVMLLELVVLIAGIAHGNIPLILLDLLIMLLHILMKLKEHQKHEKNAAKIAQIETELQQKQASLLE